MSLDHLAMAGLAIMATRTVRFDELANGNFVGGGNDTLALSGTWPQQFDLTQATFTGYKTITADGDFNIKMTSEQFSSISAIDGDYSFVTIVGSTLDLR